MPTHVDLLRQLARKSDSKIVLLMMDGVGGIHTGAAPRTALEKASTPNLDRLAEESESPVLAQVSTPKALIRGIQA